MRDCKKQTIIFYTTARNVEKCARKNTIIAIMTALIMLIAQDTKYAHIQKQQR